jgi:dCMP deaminase
MNEFSRPKWDEYFMNVAHVVKSRSNCITRQVGAILVKNRQIISTGYNGTPKGVKNCYEGGCKRCNDRMDGNVESGKDLDKCVCSHAEENAVVQAAFHGISTKDATLYTTNTPCTTCAKILINAGIKKIVAEGDYPDELGTRLLEEAGVGFVRFGKK